MSMKRNLRSGFPLWLVVVLVAALALPAVAQENKPANTLYKRLGGYDVIAGVVDEFLNRLRADPQFTKFTIGLATTSKRRNRQLIVNQLCEMSGGPCLYIGRTMKGSHEGIPITEQDWEATGKHMLAALEKFNVPQREKEEFMALIGTLKDDIVAKPEKK